MLFSNIVKTLRENAAQLACANPLYTLPLIGEQAPDVSMILTDSWPGDPERGRSLCEGVFTVGGEQLSLHSDCWEPVGISENWLRHVHGFSWLRDLRALGGDQARRQARFFIDSWARRHSKPTVVSLRPGIAGQRMANWIALYDFFGASADEEFQDRFFVSLNRQARLLARALPGIAEGVDLFHGIRGLAFAGLVFENRESWLMQALDVLQTEIEKQILPDGGHISRNPEQLSEALMIFTDLRAALLAANYPVPVAMEHTIDRMAQALRFFRYTDKGLALFNGSQEGDTALLDSILARANARGRILRHLPATGYERLTLGRSLLMVDTGTSPRRPYDKAMHAAPLAFELTYGRERIFSPCGTHPVEEGWRDVLRGTPAHNTVTLDHRGACEILENGSIGRKPIHIDAVREDGKDALLLEAVHDGYVPLNGITHRRRFYLADGGHDFRGEDILTCTTGLNQPVTVTLRFHLHPGVQVSLIRDGTEALLRLRGGAGWRFFFTGGFLSLEDSIYLGQGCIPRKTKQIVIEGVMDSDHAQIKWALQREGL